MSDSGRKVMDKIYSRFYVNVNHIINNMKQQIKTDCHNDSMELPKDFKEASCITIKTNDTDKLEVNTIDSSIITINFATKSFNMTGKTLQKAIEYYFSEKTSKTPEGFVPNLDDPKEYKLPQVFDKLRNKTNP